MHKAILLPKTFLSSYEQMYRMDASEGSTLQKKYGFRTIPMLLMFFEGRLVEATNAPGSAPAIKVSLDLKDSRLGMEREGMEGKNGGQPCCRCLE